MIGNGLKVFKKARVDAVDTESQGKFRTKFTVEDVSSPNSDAVFPSMLL